MAENKTLIKYMILIYNSAYLELSCIGRKEDVNS